MPGPFLPTTRPATFMFDVVVLAMIIVLPILTLGIMLVKRRHWHWHRQVQSILGLVLLAAVLLFETDIRLNKAWWTQAQASPWHVRGVLGPFLAFHVLIAVTTTLLWIITIAQAWRRFPNPTTPNEYSPRHRRLAWAAAIGMFATACTGWLFYWMAFIAV